MGFADLHIHTIHSYDGTASISAVLKHVASHTDLYVIAITDHDTLSGVDQAQELAPDYGIEVIPGCEISTADGHLLALFIHQPVPAGLSLVRTVELIGEQGGICIAAHPTAFGINSLNFNTIRQALRQPGIDQVLVGIEAFNGGLVCTRRNPIVEILSAALPLAQTGNSDSHILATIGQGSSEFAGTTASELRTALEQATTRVRKRITVPNTAVVTNYLPRIALRKLGWVTDNVSPASPMTHSRLADALAHQYPHTKPLSLQALHDC